MTMKVFMLLIFFIRLVVPTPVSLANQPGSLQNSTYVNKNTFNCKNMNCPAVEQPLCVRVKQDAPERDKKPIYIIVLNKCELSMMKCHKDLRATVLPMKYCSHELQTDTDLPKKRSKRQANGIVNRPMLASNEPSEKFFAKPMFQSSDGEETRQALSAKKSKLPRPQKQTRQAPDKRTKPRVVPKGDEIKNKVLKASNKGSAKFFGKPMFQSSEGEDSREMLNKEQRDPLEVPLSSLEATQPQSKLMGKGNNKVVLANNEASGKFFDKPMFQSSDDEENRQDFHEEKHDPVKEQVVALSSPEETQPQPKPMGTDDNAVMLASNEASGKFFAKPMFQSSDDEEVRQVLQEKKMNHITRPGQPDPQKRTRARPSKLNQSGVKVKGDQSKKVALLTNDKDSGKFFAKPMFQSSESKDNRHVLNEEKQDPVEIPLSSPEETQPQSKPAAKGNNVVMLANNEGSGKFFSKPMFQSSDGEESRQVLQEKKQPQGDQSKKEVLLAGDKSSGKFFAKPMFQSSESEDNRHVLNKEKQDPVEIPLSSPEVAQPQSKPAAKGGVKVKLQDKKNTQTVKEKQKLKVKALSSKGKFFNRPMFGSDTDSDKGNTVMNKGLVPDNDELDSTHGDQAPPDGQIEKLDETVADPVHVVDDHKFPGENVHDPDENQNFPDIYPHGSDDNHEIPDSNNEYDTTCPRSCPVRSTMLCARCSHGIYKTFPSTCHMRLFNCNHKTERVELVAQRECAASAPYLKDVVEIEGRVKDRNDPDPILKVIYNRKWKQMDEKKISNEFKKKY